MGITNAAAVANAMAVIYKMRGMKAQFTRFSKTLRLFQASTGVMEGSSKKIKVLVQPMTAVRPTKTGQESEFPVARTIDWAEWEVAWSDLCELQASYNYTGYARQQAKSKKASVFDAATDLIGTADEDFATQLNAQLHQNANCDIAQVSAVYDDDGSTGYSSGAAYIKIEDGSISQFVKGMAITFIDSDGTDVDATVNDVFTGREGKTGTSGNGPGIVVTEKTGESTGFGSLAQNDPIRLEDVSTSSNFSSFPVWFARTGTLYGINRATVGNAWTWPHIKTWYDSANVTLDLDEHLGEVAEDLAYAIDRGRRIRPEKGIALTSAAMAFLSTPKICSEASRQVGDQMRQVTDLDKSIRKELFGTTGFDKAYWHNPLLGPVMFQHDPVATPNCFRMLEPNSWQWILGHKGSLQSVEWLNADGSLWHYQYGDNGRLVNSMIAGALMRVSLLCDQPLANLQGSGVKSSLD